MNKIPFLKAELATACDAAVAADTERDATHDRAYAARAAYDAGVAEASNDDRDAEIASVRAIYDGIIKQQRIYNQRKK